PEGLQRLVDEATRALSCNAGFAHVPELGLTVASEASCSFAARPGELDAALATIARDWTPPVCVQEAAGGDLPAPLSASHGVVSYFLLPLEEPVAGILLLLHTEASAA